MTYEMTVKVDVGSRKYVQRLLKDLNTFDTIVEIEGGGYTDGSTAWEFDVTSSLNTDEIEAALAEDYLGSIEVHESK